MNDPLAVLSSFDEGEYLRRNPDVAQAVTAGSFQSGWVHALLYGCCEQRPGLSEETLRHVSKLEQNIADTIPPPDLRVRVHGAPDLASFYFVGAVIAGNIEQQLAAHGLKPPSHANVLDFGCGCGRVISHLGRRRTEWRFKGSDIDQDAVQWCVGHLGDMAEFKQNGIWPPLEYQASSFDLIYSISVFTHLPEEMQFAWLQELTRVAKPHGVLFLSTHNMSLLPHSVPESSGENGFYYLSGCVTPGLPNFYQRSFHDHKYIMDNWTQYFDIISIVPKGINGHQDLVICRMRES
jgi:SAM-dependent methyltransferase